MIGLAEFVDFADTFKWFHDVVDAKQALEDFNEVGIFEKRLAVSEKCILVGGRNEWCK